MGAASRAWAFNIGQVAVVSFIVGDPRVGLYILPLFAAGSAAGWAVGWLAGKICARLGYNDRQERI